MRRTSTVLLRDLYRAGFDRARFTQSHPLTRRVWLESLPNAVKRQAVITVQPSADVDSPAYATRRQAARHSRPAPRQRRATDWISTVCR